MGCSVDKMGVVDIDPYPNRPAQRPNPHAYPKQTPGNYSNNNLNGNLSSANRLPPIGQQQPKDNKPTYYVNLSDDDPHTSTKDTNGKGRFEKVELNEKTIERFLQIQSESNFK